MSVASEPGSTRIYTEEHPRRSPPVTETGLIGWLRHNLFSTPFDAIVTLISLYVVYAVVSGAIVWAVRDANWFAITRNLTLFMLGPLQVDPVAVTNVQLMTLILALAVGLSFAAWAHIGPRSWIALAVFAVACLVVPRVIASTIPMPASVFSAGTTGVVSGSVTERPVGELAFIAAEGEQITIALADRATDDIGLTGVAAFTDRATDAMVNAARNRVEALRRLEEIEARLADPSLPNSERAQLIPQRDTLAAAAADPVAETYGINTTPVTVRVLARDLETVLAEGVLTDGSEPISFTAPADGWYILQKSTEGESIGLIETHGVYPHIERQFARPLRDESGQIVLGVNGLPRQVNITEYTRITDDFTIEAAAPPRREGTDVPRMLIVDNQYRGERPLADYLILHLGPFVEKVSRALIPCLIVVFAGYMLGNLLSRYAPPVVKSVYALVDRVTGDNRAPGAARRGLVSGLIRRWHWLAAYLALYAVVAAVFRQSAPMNAGIALGALIVLSISVSMLRPGLNTPYASRVVSWLWFVMPFIIYFLVSGTDLGRWGGLFLTFMLTAVGIVASFPIGVLLALGRRADNLPVIKYLCIAFIEIVRGVPLITVLFLASLALPLVSPALSTVPQGIRAMVAITLFSAAYLAENVRGGLQSIPPGQSEAARALGMNPVQVTMFITLPQALRAVIPALVGQCIALFKDTSLVAIVGLLDLTENADSVVSQAEYIGLRREAYIFISIVYFVFSYAMAYVSRKLEQSGSGRARQTKL